MEIPDLTRFERKVWDAFSYGRDVEFSSPSDEKTGQGHSWGLGRFVRAEAIRKLLVRGQPPDGASHGHVPYAVE
ncbi:hypothetical protein GCM10023191_005930 [Actinoallomurus oryzae]|uniref:Uncharacterized protein n=1 Tax=Actinoallomurus oryzae TaxID=502180 RepID=A0ABP8PC09_9ACTN